MNASWVAARAGVRRGWIELKHTFTTPGDLVTLLIFTGILLGVMLWTRNTTVPARTSRSAPPCWPACSA